MLSLETAAEIARDTGLSYKKICCLQNICKKKSLKKNQRPKAASLLIFIYIKKKKKKNLITNVLFIFLKKNIRLRHNLLVAFEA